MLDDRRQRHRQGSREAADARRARAKALDDLAPSGISEGMQDLVEVRSLVKHVPNNAPS